MERLFKLLDAKASDNVGCQPLQPLFTSLSVKSGKSTVSQHEARCRAAEVFLPYVLVTTVTAVEQGCCRSQPSAETARALCGASNTPRCRSRSRCSLSRFSPRLGLAAHRPPLLQLRCLTLHHHFVSSRKVPLNPAADRSSRLVQVGGNPLGAAARSHDGRLVIQSRSTLPAASPCQLVCSGDEAIRFHCSCHKAPRAPRSAPPAGR